MQQMFHLKIVHRFLRLRRESTDDDDDEDDRRWDDGEPADGHKMRRRATQRQQCSANAGECRVHVVAFTVHIQSNK